MNDLISVIVPFYNVQKYLDKCLSSIVNQSYKNIEIIIVDDGSKDGSDKIYKKYEITDKRIKIICSDNNGISCARNIGIKNATGKYVGFVDGDDYIELNMFEKLYRNIQKYDADISIASFVHEDEDGNLLESKERSKDIFLWNKMEGLNNLIKEENLTNHLWNKLYKRDLFENVQFPVSKTMEDIATTYKLFEKSNKIVFENDIVYHYIQRKNSIMGKLTEKRIKDTEEAIFTKNSYLEKEYPELRDAIQIENIKTYKLLHYLAKMGGYKELLKSTKYLEYYKNYKKNYLKYRKKIKRNIGKKVVLTYDLFYISKRCYYMYIDLKRG